MSSPLYEIRLDSEPRAWVQQSSSYNLLEAQCGLGVLLSVDFNAYEFGTKYHSIEAEGKYMRNRRKLHAKAVQVYELK